MGHGFSFISARVGDGLSVYRQVCQRCAKGVGCNLRFAMVGKGSLVCFQVNKADNGFGLSFS